MNIEPALKSAAARACACPVTLSVPSSFSGRVVVHLKDGRAIADYRLNQADHISTLSGFIELARLVGWTVIPPYQSEGDASGTDSNPNS
ncbi:hypothetical protein UYSO10_4985 [Kosakonia radicincitans]|uniref:hypothetical protein n=1 Tax=Kosakonia radicincitans TaxID=283686 RepID=UPI0011820C1A|nr:hypothetical protein [Kosakonia radicincitans]VVT53984.1 hypothetical protein UYSO10_4985 [Kosakonia radicincitans]